MGQVLAAIYEDGVFKPLERPRLAERQRVTLELRESVSASAAAALAGWRKVYEGLSEAEIGEIEVMALDRSRFMGEPG